MMDRLGPPSDSPRYDDSGLGNSDGTSYYAGEFRQAAARTPAADQAAESVWDREHPSIAQYSDVTSPDSAGPERHEEDDRHSLPVAESAVEPAGAGDEQEVGRERIDTTGFTYEADDLHTGARVSEPRLDQGGVAGNDGHDNGKHPREGKTDFDEGDEGEQRNAAEDKSVEGTAGTLTATPNQIPERRRGATKTFGQYRVEAQRDADRLRDAARREQEKVDGDGETGNDQAGEYEDDSTGTPTWHPPAGQRHDDTRSFRHFREQALQEDERRRRADQGERPDSNDTGIVHEHRDVIPPTGQSGNGERVTGVADQAGRLNGTGSQDSVTRRPGEDEAGGEFRLWVADASGVVDAVSVVDPEDSQVLRLNLDSSRTGIQDTAFNGYAAEHDTPQGSNGRIPEPLHEWTFRLMGEGPDGEAQAIAALDNYERHGILPAGLLEEQGQFSLFTPDDSTESNRPTADATTGGNDEQGARREEDGQLTSDQSDIMPDAQEPAPVAASGAGRDGDDIGRHPREGLTAVGDGDADEGSDGDNVRSLDEARAARAERYAKWFGEDVDGPNLNDLPTVMQDFVRTLFDETEYPEHIYHTVEELELEGDYDGATTVLEEYKKSITPKLEPVPDPDQGLEVGSESRVDNSAGDGTGSDAEDGANLFDLNEIDNPEKLNDYLKTLYKRSDEEQAALYKDYTSTKERLDAIRKEVAGETEPTGEQLVELDAANSALDAAIDRLIPRLSTDGKVDEGHASQDGRQNLREQLDSSAFDAIVGDRIDGQLSEQDFYFTDVEAAELSYNDAREALARLIESGAASKSIDDAERTYNQARQAYLDAISTIASDETPMTDATSAEEVTDGAIAAQVGESWDARDAQAALDAETDIEAYMTEDGAGEMPADEQTDERDARIEELRQLAREAAWRRAELRRNFTDKGIEARRDGSMPGSTWDEVDETGPRISIYPLGETDESTGPIINLYHHEGADLARVEGLDERFRGWLERVEGVESGVDGVEDLTPDQQSILPNRIQEIVDIDWDGQGTPTEEIDLSQFYYDMLRRYNRDPDEHNRLIEEYADTRTRYEEARVAYDQALANAQAADEEQPLDAINYGTDDSETLGAVSETLPGNPANLAENLGQGQVDDDSTDELEESADTPAAMDYPVDAEADPTLYALIRAAQELHNATNEYVAAIQRLAPDAIVTTDRIEPEERRAHDRPHDTVGDWSEQRQISVSEKSESIEAQDLRDATELAFFGKEYETYVEDHETTEGPEFTGSYRRTETFDPVAGMAAEITEFVGLVRDNDEMTSVRRVTVKWADGRFQQIDLDSGEIMRHEGEQPLLPYQQAEVREKIKNAIGAAFDDNL